MSDFGDQVSKLPFYYDASSAETKRIGIVSSNEKGTNVEIDGASKTEYKDAKLPQDVVILENLKNSLKFINGDIQEVEELPSPMSSSRRGVVADFNIPKDSSINGMTIKTGSDDDWLGVKNVSKNIKSLAIDTGEGNDHVTLMSDKTEGNLSLISVDTGKGDDTVLMSSSQDNIISINTGEGSDFVHILLDEKGKSTSIDTGGSELGKNPDLIKLAGQGDFILSSNNVNQETPVIQFTHRSDDNILNHYQMKPGKFEGILNFEMTKENIEKAIETGSINVDGINSNGVRTDQEIKIESVGK